FQAEDGIRDFHVTGVQTCALPILVERARMERPAVIRIAMPSGASLPPLVDWPEDLRAAVDPLVAMVQGGHEYDGRPLVPMNHARSEERRVGKEGRCGGAAGW